MAKKTINFSKEVSNFLDEMNHPLRSEIDALRLVILDADNNLIENIKWNGPNYSFDHHDRITMRVHPPKQIQLIFHRGAKVQAQPPHKLIHDPSGILNWKENDRAVATFKNIGDITNFKSALSKIVADWIQATT